MHESMQGLRDELASARRDLLASVEGLEQDELDRRPEEDRWSVGEILHHLSRVEQGIAIMLTRGINRAMGDGASRLDGERVRSKRLAELEIETAAVRLTAPSAVEPTHAMARDEIVRALDRSRAMLFAAMESANDLDLTVVRYPHASLGELDGYEWLEFVARHERRHLRQIERARAAGG